jgi:hypothetical protein
MMHVQLVFWFSLCCFRGGAQAQTWKLVYDEDFTTSTVSTTINNIKNVEWELDDYQEPFDTIMDDAGDFYKNDYGPAFTDALESFHTYRKEIPFGTDGWLTASLSARDWNKDGVIEDEPTLEIDTLAANNRNVLTMKVPDHTGGAILRPTKALPATYRIEYKLLMLDFGGKRNGSIEYDGRVNGYGNDGCKTQHPWGEGSGSRGWSGDASSEYCDWQSVREGAYGYNGFHFLSIVDFANPAPRNNHFWHYRRKVLMDSFSQHPDRVGDNPGGQVCNVDTKEYYDYRDSSFNTINMWISGLPGTFSPNPGGLTGSSQRFITDCNGGIATRGIQSAGELMPDVLPNQYYTFAIERNATGYTLEASGTFARVGFKTLRFFRPFIVDDQPIWHYNVKASEYDGRYNNDLQQDNWAFGSQTWKDQWPAGSAYPDYFVIGDLYTNVYEGSASLTDIRYYEPENKCESTILMETDNILLLGATVVRDNVFLVQQANGNLQVRRGTPNEPGVLVWESGVRGTRNDFTYYTKLQGDGNLITWQVDVNDISAISSIWQSTTVNSDGEFFLVAECSERGDGVALYQGNPNQGGQSLWRHDPLPLPQTEAPTIAPSEAPPPCERSIFMERNDELKVGETIVREYVFLVQQANGNLEIREGAPDNPGRLLWENGVRGATNDASEYYTKMQGDSHLITWRVNPSGERSAMWGSNSINPDGSYSLVLECGPRVVIIQDQDGRTVWRTDVLQLESPTDPNEPKTKPDLNPAGSPNSDSVPTSRPSAFVDRDGTIENIEGMSTSERRSGGLITVASMLLALIYNR